MPLSHKIVYVVYLLFWIIMAIDPKYRADWLLENILVFIFFPFIIRMDSRYRYSLLSIILLLIFASLHSLGSHYTYAEMEHFDTITQLFGFERNHYDRVVHFLFGFLLFRLFFEMIIIHVTHWKAALIFTVMTVLSISAIYEIIEWLVAIMINPELGHAFLGSQGDIWDAQKDTLVAFIGALLNLIGYRSYKQLFMNKHR
jgi:putative membrane protein